MRFGHDGFAVGDRNLVVVRVDFVEGQETVAIAAEFDERRLKRWFDPGYFGKVDIAFDPNWKNPMPRPARGGE